MGDPLQIVIAEDNYLVREGVRRLLEDSGRVSVLAGVGTAVELLDAVRRLAPQAVLTDIRMPPTHRMEGIEAAHAIRASYPDIGVVVLSQVMSASLGLSFQTELQNAIPDPDPQTKYSFAVYGWINLVAAVLQFLAAPLLLHVLPAGLLQLLIPVVQLAVVGYSIAQPSLVPIAVAGVSTPATSGKASPSVASESTDSPSMTAVPAYPGSP